MSPRARKQDLLSEYSLDRNMLATVASQCLQVYGYFTCSTSSLGANRSCLTEWQLKWPWWRRPSCGSGAEESIWS
eukprot:1063877-Pleurochrysis_carterae.AAC.1